MKKRYQNIRDDGSDYTRGYQDGINAAFDSSELDAYYAGVGFGKMAAGDKYLGFRSDEEKDEFEKGILNKDKHFKFYSAQPPSLWERLFGKKIGFGKINYTSKANIRSEKRDKKRAANKAKREQRKQQRASRKASRDFIRRRKAERRADYKRRKAERRADYKYRRKLIKYSAKMSSKSYKRGRR